MLVLSELLLSNFKNYVEARITPCAHVNCFSGKNGSGKTNLLDALYYLSFTKSYFTPSEQHILREGAPFLAVEGHYLRNDLQETVRISWQAGDKKHLKVNNNDVRPFSDHIGCYPLVMITPNDIMLIYEGSEERRKFLDGMIAQLDKVYLNDLLSYNRTLEQRNRLLRQSESAPDPALLSTYNAQLVEFGNRIFERRTAFLHDFIPVFRTYYSRISSTSETVNLHYVSDLNLNRFDTLLQQHAANDLAAQRTTKGIHKDELEFHIREFPLKKYGSQGQQKSFIIALKLAQYAYLRDKTGIRPLFLLDDIFEKLDSERLEKLLSMIAGDEFGQLFITDTHAERMKDVFGAMQHTEVRYFDVQAGIITEL